MYQKREIGELGNLEFYGNIGAVALFEDATGKSISEAFDQNPKLSDIIELVYSCHKIACYRQKETVKVTIDEFKANSGKELIDLFQILMGNVVKELTFGQSDNSVEKKILKKK
jgi:hypothetical protein